MTAFDLSDDQAEFRGVLRRLCDEKIGPRAAEYDEQERFPWESFHDCVAMELPALGVPQEYGGAGADHVTQALVIEEVRARLRLDKRHASHLEARDDPRHQLRQARR